MACGEYSGRLDELEDYLHGELEESAARALTAHLNRCSACREEMQSMQFAVRLLQEGIEPQGEVNGVFWTRLRAKLRAEEARSQSGDFWQAMETLARKLSMVSALALLILGGFVVGIEWRDRALPNHQQQQTEARELFPEPPGQPSNQEEVLVSLATRENGR